jgi:DNA (cytosine-5)-methyltransferase 1
VSAYYNEHDPFAAAWLRELIADGLIAPGEVDERSIEDVRPDELAGFVQCHWFAGIGIWSLALRQAGWPDDAPIWTGSCPCQPFSAAGKGGGFDDERHLWPTFHWLIEQCAPELVLGEQVASKDGLAWLDLVSADLEATGYAFGAADTCAAGFGSPHIRQRLYWMADACGEAESGRRIFKPGESSGALEGRLAERECAGERAARQGSVGGGLADSDGRNASAEGLQRSGEQRQQPQDGGAGGMGNAGGSGARGDAGTASRAQESGRGTRIEHGIVSGHEPVASIHDGRPGPLNGLWRDADWLCCTDGKWRPVAPGTFPLAPAGSVRNRVGTLRGAGTRSTSRKRKPSSKS